MDIENSAITGLGSAAMWLFVLDSDAREHWGREYRAGEWQEAAEAPRHFFPRQEGLIPSWLVDAIARVKHDDQGYLGIMEETVELARARAQKTRAESRLVAQYAVTNWSTMRLQKSPLTGLSMCAAASIQQERVYICL